MSVNKFIGIGNLTRDVEVKFMTSGEAVANCSIACNEKWKDKQGQKQEKVEYINLVFYRRLAEIAGEYLKKGSMIYVEGKLQTRKYTDKAGVEKYSPEIIVNERTMLGGKSSAGVEEPEPAPTPKKPASKNAFDDFDDGIPF